MASMFFQNSLAEVVRKLRSNTSGSEDEAIDKYVADTKNEVNANDARVKYTAIQKATYFHMLGYSSAYANFRVVELMASSSFLYKRAAYLAACTTFSEDTDVITLMTALLKRDLGSGNQYEVGMALYCIASICTADMAQDVAADVVNLLSHTRSYVRKKAALSLYRIFLQYPESLRITYLKLKEKLDDNSDKSDTDPAVRGAVVCVLCELARRNPANFLGLAVPFYSLLSTVHSNWTLIKVVKVFGYFAPLEPRLGKKLVEPLTALISNTGAKSVQYECILAVANGMSKVASITQLAAEKIIQFVEDSDPNLRFLGLEAMALLVAENRKLLSGHRDVVLRCLDDADGTIRRKALTVLRDLTSKKTIVAHINHMADRCVRTPADEEWSNAVVRTIIETAQTDDYSGIQDFEWYLGVLLDLCTIPLTTYTNGALMGQELVTVVSRVNGARQYGVTQLAPLLDDSQLLQCGHQKSTQWRVLCAAAFVCGEYPYWVPDKATTCSHLLSEAVSLLPAEAQIACVGAVGKIAAYVVAPCPRHTDLCNGEEECAAEAPASAPVTIEELRLVLSPESTGEEEQDGETPRPPQGLDLFCRSIYPDVQERAHLVHYEVFVKPEVGPSLYEKELRPVAEGAQDAIEVPADLDLETPFCEDMSALLALSTSEEEEDGYGSDPNRDYGGADFSLEYRVEQQKKIEQARREEMAAFYLGDQDEGEVKPAAAPFRFGDDDGEEEVGARQNRGRYLASRKGESASSHRASHRHTGTRKTFNMNRDLSKPDTYVEANKATAARARRSASPEEDETTRKLRQIDVTRALREEERLPETLSYAQLMQQKEQGGQRSSAVFRQSPAPASAPTTVLDTSKVRVYVTVESCKVSKEGYALRCSWECVNGSANSSLYDVHISLVSADGDKDASQAACATLFSVSTDGYAEESTGAVKLAARLKAGTSAKVSAVLRLTQLPLSFLAPKPLSVRIHYKKDRKVAEEVADWPLRYVDFTKVIVPKAVLSSEEFYEKVLRGALAAATSSSSFVPCSKATIMLSVSQSLQQLRLAPIDIFKDTISLYGLLHGRKSELDLTHVAVLLQQREENGEKGLLMVVRAHQPALRESLLDQLSQIIAKNQMD